MNSESSCHEIPDCGGIFVDAFRGHFLRKTQDHNNHFILTHYHGDHYGNLPKEFKYTGPALIHCTKVTAELLRTVHEVPDQFVVEHPYAYTWTLRTTGPDSFLVRVTLYDANHCPGAAIILFEMPDGRVHLHTGDMRYHEKMKSYGLLKEAAINRRVEVVLLDTTYGHPKHDFVSQEEAIESISTQVEEIFCLDKKHGTKSLVLLSCYSIGKEKVLWEASKRANSKVFVSERKFKMLKCIQSYEEEASCQIIERCTRNPNETDIHVIPMGLAGEMWPFFRANYWSCADYAREQEEKYSRVVAFVPTGWAEASNWNKKNAVTEMDCRGIIAQVRLISYSEHSAFSELQDFVRFLRPRKIIPTVYKNKNDQRKIEAHFSIDSNRAKIHFLKSMKATITHQDETAASLDIETRPLIGSSTIERSIEGKRKRNMKGSDMISELKSMGFEWKAAEKALTACSGDINRAIETLLAEKKEATFSGRLSQRKSDIVCNDIDEGTTPVNVMYSESSKEQLSPSFKSPRITNFFRPKGQCK